MVYDRRQRIRRLATSRHRRRGNRMLPQLRTWKPRGRVTWNLANLRRRLQHGRQLQLERNSSDRQARDGGRGAIRVRVDFQCGPVGRRPVLGNRPNPIHARVGRERDAHDEQHYELQHASEYLPASDLPVGDDDGADEQALVYHTRAAEPELLDLVALCGDRTWHHRCEWEGF